MIVGSERKLDRSLGSAALASALLALVASSATAGIHTWDVREVYSNASGTVQYVELFDAGSGGLEVGVSGGTISSNTQTFTWASPAVAPPTNGKSYLIASQSFASQPGAPVPDAIIPASKMPFFNPAGDTVSFGPYDSWTFGAVPTNGTQSLDDVTGVGARTPKNYAGIQGGIPVPTATFWMTTLLGASLAAMGAVVLRRRRAVALD